MFTGLVDNIGVIQAVQPSPAGLELRVACVYADLAVGESIAVSGACLTVREAGPAWFIAAAMEATRSRTTMGDWQVGRRVNLERALRASDRLGGHIVQGHVDAVGRVVAAREGDDALLIDVDVGGDLEELLVPHGSIALDGVSLTLNAVPSPAVAQVAIIEYTRKHTTLGDLKEGDSVNVEGDVIGKYVRRLLGAHARFDL
ncbi:MAG: riboflavin synthase [Gemmatimonadaceae bacterium]